MKCDSVRHIAEGSGWLHQIHKVNLAGLAIRSSGNRNLLRRTDRLATRVRRRHGVIAASVSHAPAARFLLRGHVVRRQHARHQRCSPENHYEGKNPEFGDSFHLLRSA